MAWTCGCPIIGDTLYGGGGGGDDDGGGSGSGTVATGGVGTVSCGGTASDSDSISEEGLQEWQQKKNVE